MELDISTTAAAVTEGNASVAPDASPYGANSICLPVSFATYTCVPSFLCAFGLCGNTLSILCLRGQNPLSPTAFLLISLAVVDNFVLVTQASVSVWSSGLQAMVSSSAATFIQNIRPYTVVYIRPMAFVFQLVTIYLTVGVTLLRYLSAYKAQPNPISKTTPRLMVTGIVVFSVVFSAPVFAEYYVEKAPNIGVYVAARTFVNSRFYQVAYIAILQSFVFYGFPLLSLSWLSYRLCEVLHRARKRHDSMTSHTSQGYKITKTLVAVVFVFMVCHVFGPIHKVVFAFSDDKFTCSLPIWSLTVVYTNCILINSSVNCMIFSLCSKRFRTAMIMVLRCQTFAVAPLADK